MVMDLPPPRSRVAVAGGLGRLDLSWWAWQAATKRTSPRQSDENVAIALRIIFSCGWQVLDGRERAGKSEGLPLALNKI